MVLLTFYAGFLLLTDSTAAIPFSLLSLSQRFKKVLPELLAVPGFTGIRIHAGNTQADTAGCLLVGRVRAYDRVEESKLALMHVMEQLRRATTAGDPITISVEE